MAKRKYHQGYYKPKNPKKWIVIQSGLGAGKIVYRSGWERRFMIWADNNENIISISSEPFPIPYFSQVDGKRRRYYIDFYIKTKDGKKILIEIKPFAETQPPKKSKNQKRFLSEAETFVRNTDKWKAAKEFCELNNMSFVIMDEYGLGIKKRKVK